MVYPLVATRKGIFARMCMLMNKDERYREVSPYFRQNFCLIRAHAEELAKFHCRVNDIETVTQSRIYDAMLMTDEISEAEASSILQLEEKLTAELWARSFPSEETEAFEELSWLDGVEEDFSAQLLAGAAKRAVIEKNLSGASRIGAFLGGPILMPYVQWFLRRSKTSGFKRLYFIARDGYILKCMADTLIEHLGLKIDTYYIHGSRKAWRMPSYRGMERELRGLVGWSHTQHIHSVEDLAESLLLPVDKLRPYLLPEFAEKGRKLNLHELAACVYLLDKSVDFRRMLQASLSEKRYIIVEYLKQEIDISDDNFAFVELGGGGFTQICLSHLMRDFYKGKVRTFFYKMDRVRKPDEECEFYNFFPSKLKNDLVIEMVCRAAEGQTEGYKHEAGRVVPVKQEGERELYLKAGYDDYMKGIEAFTEAYKDAVQKYRPEPSLKTSIACIEYISNQADDETMSFFAELPNRLTGREKEVPSFAPPLTKRQVQDIYVRYADGILGAHYIGTDYNMSIRRSSPYIQRLVEKYKKIGWKIRERWLRMYPELCSYTHYNFTCPYSVLGRRVVLYGAGKRGQRWYKELSADKAIEVVQWLDKGYLRLKDELSVSGDMDSLGQVPFDWLLVDFADAGVLQSVVEELQEHGVAPEKIYTRQRISDWVASWINYLHV